MKQKIGWITLLVRDYDEAIAFYTEKLRFEVLEDTAMGDGKRWVVVAPPDGEGSGLLLAKAASSEQEKRIGTQAGERVFLFLQTEDFRRSYEYMKSRGVVFLEEPREEAYGAVVVFEDLYGNKWDFLELKNSKSKK